MIDILIAYAGNTTDMLDICLSNIKEYSSKDHKLTVGYRLKDDSNTLQRVLRTYKAEPCVIPESRIAKGWEHGSALNYMADTTSNQLILTMDSDCFPIAKGWLEDLLDAIEGTKESDSASAGILHPWSPPPKSIKSNSIEYRVRKQHCWNVTHVACQMIFRSDYLAAIKRGISFVSGDDTGLGLVLEIQNNWRLSKGFMPTGCPKPINGCDAEFNRYSCVVYGDKVIHLGGHSRKTIKGETIFDGGFGWAIDKIVKERNASWLLNDMYRFKFDKEEEVSKEHMNRLFGFEKERMSL